MMMKRLALAAAVLGTSVSGALAQAPAWEMKKASLMTRFAKDVDPKNVLPEYPRPQLVRDAWQNLNGIWQYQPGKEGDAAPVGKDLSSSILVPFPVESAISGVMEHHDRLWYRRTFDVPAAWSGKKVLLHFGAVDYECEVFLNGKSLGVHTGGYEPFALDVTPALKDGPQELIVRVYDPTDKDGFPRGKQTTKPGGIMYTPTTGIWQTVWLEPVAQTSIADLHMVPDIDAGVVKITADTGDTSAAKVHLVIKDGGKTIAEIDGATNTELNASIPNAKLWSPDSPFLYDVEATLDSGDRVTSYFGMRKISLGVGAGGVKQTFLNNKFLFEFGPLDQGFWPDGIYTAPTDAALKSDIEMTKAWGFNMIRKHIKVEPARWYYWADKLGIMVWQDMPSADSYLGRGAPRPKVDAAAFEKQLRTTIHAHWNSPAIIMWVTFNEGQGQGQLDTEKLVALAKQLDPSRLVNQASGGQHKGVGDIFDIHAYPPPRCPEPNADMAIACGEFGGIGLGIPDHIYGQRVNGYTMTSTPLELAIQYAEFANMLKGFRDDHGMSAAVYTQTTDVEDEMNGLMTYDRIPKVPPQYIAKANAFAFPLPKFTPVLPTAQQEYGGATQTWKYTFDKPANGWNKPTFDDTSWKQGKSGFGRPGPGAMGAVGTTWNTNDVWLRRNFDASKLSKADLDNLVLRLYHDDDVQVFINGVQAHQRRKFLTSYMTVTLPKEVKATITPDDKNVIAVHCLQNTGGQYVDVGLAIRAMDLTGLPELPETPKVP